MQTPPEPPSPLPPEDFGPPIEHPDPSDATGNEPALSRRSDPGSPGAGRFAWIMVAAAVGLIILSHSAAPEAPEGSADSPTPTAGVLKLLARYAAGASEFTGATGDEEQTATIREQLVSPIEAAVVSRDDSLRAALVVFGLGDDDRAMTLVNGALAPAEGSTTSSDSGAESPDDATATGTGAESDTTADSAPDTAAIPEYVRADAARIRTLIESGADALTPADRAALEEHHGWFAEYALTRGLPSTDPARHAALAPARRVVFALVALASVAGAGLLAGIVILVFLLIRFSRGRLRTRYAPPGWGGSVYLETFAIFLVALLGLQAVGGFITGLTGVDITEGLLWIMPLILLWPLARGSRRVEAKYALGWHRGEGVFKEMGAGLVGYLAGLPVLAVGFLGTITLLAIKSALTGEQGPPPTHPIVQDAGATSLWGILSIYLLASVWAPIVEESMFRGALFHHLRGRFGAVAAAAMVGFIFAIIHPQGILLVPPLMALGFVFCLIREWRGSLIGSMTAHAVHNAILMTVLITAMR